MLIATGLTVMRKLLHFQYIGMMHQILNITVKFLISGRKRRMLPPFSFFTRSHCITPLFISQNPRHKSRGFFIRRNLYKSFYFTNSSSNGLIVWILITFASIPSAASFSAACNASFTHKPVAKIVTSLPSLNTIPLPISNL